MSEKTVTISEERFLELHEELIHLRSFREGVECWRNSQEYFSVLADAERWRRQQEPPETSAFPEWDEELKQRERDAELGAQVRKMADKHCALISQDGWTIGKFRGPLNARSYVADGHCWFETPEEALNTLGV